MGGVVNLITNDGERLQFHIEDWARAKNYIGSIVHTTDGVPYWLTFDEYFFCHATRLSEVDIELIEQFGQVWVNFIRAAR